MKDSSDVVNRFKNIPPELFDKGYRFVLFDMEILFQKCSPTDILYVNVILKRIYDDELINTDL